MVRNNSGRKGMPLHKARTPDELAEQERRREALRLMVRANGGPKAYAERVGITAGVIGKMLIGESRVSDRALGKENENGRQANAEGGRFDDGGVMREKGGVF